MGIRHRLVKGEKLSAYVHQLTVEHTTDGFFGFGKQSWIQIYRYDGGWRLYPQGRRLAVDGWEWPFNDWLEIQVQQYKWSQEA